MFCSWYQHFNHRPCPMVRRFPRPPFPDVSPLAAEPPSWRWRGGAMWRSGLFSPELASQLLSICWCDQAAGYSLLLTKKINIFLCGTFYELYSHVMIFLYHVFRCSVAVLFYALALFFVSDFWVIIILEGPCRYGNLWFLIVHTSHIFPLCIQVHSNFVVVLSIYIFSTLIDIG